MAQRVPLVQSRSRGGGSGGGTAIRVCSSPVPHLPLLRLLRPAALPSGPLCSAALLLVLPMVGQPRLLSSVMDEPQPQHGSPGAARQNQPSLSTAPAAEPSGFYRITPERRALLNTIRYAEGTWIDGSEEGYRVLYGGGRFQNLEWHPEITVQKRYTSAAAGAYQFLPGTWREASLRLGLQNFGPSSQDQAALYLMEKRGALQEFDRLGLNRTVLARLAREWASLPASHGGSFYGQPVKRVEELLAFYGAELERQRRGGLTA